MATAGICSTFDIVIEGADLNVAKVFTAARNFRIVGISALNTAAAASTLRVTASTAGDITTTTAAPPIAGVAVVQAQAQVGPTAPVSVKNAADIAKGETITVLAGATTVQRVVLHCVGELLSFPIV